MGLPLFKPNHANFTQLDEASDLSETLKSPEMTFSRVEPHSAQKPDEVPREEESNILFFPENNSDSHNIIWQREISRRSERAISQLEALVRYKKSAQIIFVRSIQQSGLKKSRVASTQGILVDRKQA